MDREIWVILWLALAIFCVRFCFDVWVNKKITRLLLKHYRDKQFLNPAGISYFMEYNPFKIVKQVALRARIIPPELLVIPEFPHGIGAFCLGHFIVCSYSFIKDVSEKEFEGVIGHEIGHLINKTEVLFRLARYLYLGFLWGGGFLLFSVLGFVSLKIWEGEPLLSVDFIFLAGFLFYYLLLCGLCFSAYRVLSKRREFFADKRALLLTRYPQDFVNRLVKILFEEEHLCKEPGFVGLQQPETLHTHPSTNKRIMAAKRILKKRGIAK